MTSSSPSSAEAKRGNASSVDGAGLEQQRDHRHLHVVLLGVELLAERLEVGDVRVVVVGDERDLRPRRGEVRRRALLDAGERDALLALLGRRAGFAGAAAAAVLARLHVLGEDPALAPVPSTVERSTSSSRASRRTDGLAYGGASRSGGVSTSLTGGASWPSAVVVEDASADSAVAMTGRPPPRASAPSSSPAGGPAAASGDASAFRRRAVLRRGDPRDDRALRRGVADLQQISSTVPANGAGTSIDALSVSSVISGSSTRRSRRPRRAPRRPARR
jgi:hypothetical protein